MTHADINNLEIVGYIFDTGEKKIGIEGHYDKNIDAIVFPRPAFDCFVRRYLNGEVNDYETDLEKYVFGCP